MSTISIDVGSPYGPANLPYGVFSTPETTPRVCARVGDSVVDLATALGDDIFAQPSLNPFLAQGYERWSEVRSDIIALLETDVPETAVHSIADIQLHLPVEIGDYVDFYASEHHATNLGRLFRPNAEPLLPNWKHLPVGYHGRASTVVVSSTDILRPHGQRTDPGQSNPSFGPTRKLDIEAELGFIVGTGSPRGTHIPVDGFERHVFGVALVNDWSARDIQAWEYAPLGPFLGKSFATSMSPWIVPLAALEAARVNTPEQTPAPLPYLREEHPWGLNINLSVSWNGNEVSRPPYRQMYWSPAQMLAHMTCNGAATRTGDLYASGTISGPRKDQRGAFIELTWNGEQPIRVNGEPRTFLLDGDEVSITATAPGADGNPIGFGEVRGRIRPGVPFNIALTGDPLRP